MAGDLDKGPNAGPSVVSRIVNVLINPENRKKTLDKLNRFLEDPAGTKEERDTWRSNKKNPSFRKMNLTTMRSVAAALEKKIRADASGEETGGEAEKALDTGEMPRPASTETGTTSTAEEPIRKPEPLSQADWDKLPSSTVPAGDTASADVEADSSPQQLDFTKLKSIRDQIKNTNTADIRDIVQKIGAENIKFIKKDVSGPNAEIVTKLERDNKPIVLAIKLVDAEGKKNTSGQAYLNADNKEQDIRASASDPKNGVKLFMPDQFEELFSQIVPSKSAPDTTVKPPAPAAPPKAPAASGDRWKPLSDKLTEKGIPEDVAKKVLEFFGVQTKKVHLAEDDLLSEMPRPSGSGLQTVKFTDWLKQQGFDEVITRKIIEAVAEIAAQGKQQQLFAGSGGVGTTLTANMGYAAIPKDVTGGLPTGQIARGSKNLAAAAAGENSEPSSAIPQGNFTNEEWEQIKEKPEGWVANIKTDKGVVKIPILKVGASEDGLKRYLVYDKNGEEKIIAPSKIIGVEKSKTKSKTGAKPAAAPTAQPTTSAVTEPTVKPEISAEPETSELSQESKKLYRSLDVVSGETLGRILSLNGEYKTLHGGAPDLMAIYKFASPELQDKIKKYVKGASEVLTQIPAIKQKYDSITVEQAGTILSNAFTEFDNQNARENQAKIDKSKESSVAAPAPEPQKTTTPDEQANEQKALSYIKQKIKNAIALNTKQITVRDLYNRANFVDSSNITALLNKIKEDPEVKDSIGKMDSRPTGKILLKVGAKTRPESKTSTNGELDISKLKLGGEAGEEQTVPDEDEEEMPEDEVGGEPEQEEPQVPKKVDKKGSKAPKQPASTEDLETIKKKATSIFEKYAKKEGKEGKDLNTFIENIKKAKDKASIVQIFDNVLDETNAFKASEELNGGSSKKAEAPPAGPEIDATEAQPEPEMTPEKLEYGKKQVEKILGDSGVKISSDIKKTLETAEDESGLRDILFDGLEDATEAKMELTKALEDYDSKQVQKESITRPMFVLKEGIFRLNR